MSYLTSVKTLNVKALRATFDDAYPIEKMRGLKVGIEFPIEHQDYPSIWIDFEPSGQLEVVGIGHAEYASVEEAQQSVSRWRYQGYVTFTVCSLSSLERDLIFDELVNVFALARANRAGSTFRTMVEDNALIAANIDFDQIGQRGFSAAPGTPWQTDEVIYEATAAMEIIGEFLTSDRSGALVPISDIVVQEYTPDESSPW